MKKAATSGTSSGSVSGPTLTPAQRRARDLAKAKEYLNRAAGYREVAAGERKLGHKATASRDMKKAIKDAGKAAKYKLKAAQVGYARPVDHHRGAWVMGGNDRFPACAAAAAANSLLAVTGHRVTDDDVLALHLAAGADPDTARLLGNVFHELLTGGLGGIRPRAVRPIPAAEARVGAVVAVRAPGWPLQHAVTITSGGVATWGALGPAELLEHAVGAWAIDW